eukprot:453219_1
MSESTHSRKRRKRENEIGGIWPRLLTVGAFAWALYLRKAGVNPGQTSHNVKDKSKAVKIRSKPTSSNRPVLQPEATAQPVSRNTDLADFQIDSSRFSRLRKER